MEKELAHYMKFDGLLPENEPVAKNDVLEPEVEVHSLSNPRSHFQKPIMDSYGQKLPFEQLRILNFWELLAFSSVKF